MVVTPPVTKRWARLGPDNPRRLMHTPEAGVCLSAFIVAHQGNSILIGRPRGHDAWPEKGGYPKWQALELEKQGVWLLPATHLLMEESPDQAAERIAHEWAGLKGPPRFLMAQSHLRPVGLWNPKLKGNHWDICFVYELRPRGSFSLKPWWSEMRFAPFSEIRGIKFGRGHRDILEEAGYLSKSQKRRVQ